MPIIVYTGLAVRPFDSKRKLSKENCYYINRIGDRSRLVDPGECRNCLEIEYDPALWQPSFLKYWLMYYLCVNCDKYRTGTLQKSLNSANLAKGLIESIIRI